MPPKSKTVGKCRVCSEFPSKYRCSACPVRYCSVTCYKKHKAESCVAQPDAGPSAGPSTVSTNPPAAATGPSELSDDIFGSLGEVDSSVETKAVSEPTPLRPLTSVSWPPEPDASIFTDPLRKEDPKPLRHEELLRIATSPQLRHLLATPMLPHILRIIDALPTPSARSSALSRCLGIDDTSLSKPGGGTFLSQRDSPPPLDTLLSALAGESDGNGDGGRGAERGREGDGWWLGREGSKEGRVWIGEEERSLMRFWAGTVCGAIDGGQGDDVGWGSGALGWEM